MPDPRAVFRQSPNKHRALATLWPELHEALAGIARATTAPRCATGNHRDAPHDARPYAVARVTLNGTPACSACIAQSTRQPAGGHPLQLTDPREVR